MKYVRYFFIFAALVLCLCISAFAEPGVPDDIDSGETVPLESAPEIPVVALDPDSVQAIADAVAATDPALDVTDPTDPVTPVVDLSPDTISALAKAVGDSLSAAAVPDEEVVTYSGSALSGGYYFVADCALGKNIKFYVPSNFSVDSFAQDSGGLVNMTSSTIYALCEAYPDYTFSCSRFGHFTYRRSGSGSQTYDLNITRISDTNISLFGSDPPSALPAWQYWVVAILVLLIVGVCSVFFRRR